MASRTTTDPIEILLEMGVDLDNLSEEEDYLSALKEALATIEFQTKGAGDERTAILQKEVVKIRKQRKASAFKVKKTKISAEAFKKGTASDSSEKKSQAALPTAAIVPLRNPKINLDPVETEEPEVEKEKEKEEVKDKSKNYLKDILKSVTNIADILKKQYKVKKDTANFDRKKAERERRDLQKQNLAKRFEGLKSVAEKIVAPVSSIFDKIFGFLFNILLGRFLMKLVDWFADPKNQGKIKSIIRFLTDNWPKLLSAYLIFGTGIGKFARFLVKILAKGAVRLAAATAGLVAKLFGSRKLGKFSRFLGKRGKLVSGGIQAVATVAAFKAVEGAFTQELDSEESASIDRDIPIQPVEGFKGGGVIQPVQNFISGDSNNIFNLGDISQSSQKFDSNNISQNFLSNKNTNVSAYQGGGLVQNNSNNTSISAYQGDELVQSDQKFISGDNNTSNNTFTNAYQGGGLVNSIQKFIGGGVVKPTYKYAGGGGVNVNLIAPTNNIFGYDEGGSPAVSVDGGEVEGPGGIDKVPAMLTAGEFVMSRGAVQKYGLQELESMNAAGGGTNKPKMMSGAYYAVGGGLIGDREPADKKLNPIKQFSDRFIVGDQSFLNKLALGDTSGAIERLGIKIDTNSSALTNNTLAVRDYIKETADSFTSSTSEFMSDRQKEIQGFSEIINNRLETLGPAINTFIGDKRGEIETLGPTVVEFLNNKQKEIAGVPAAAKKQYDKAVEGLFSVVTGGLRRSEESRYVTQAEYDKLSEKEKLDKLVINSKTIDKSGRLNVTKTALTARNQARQTDTIERLQKGLRSESIFERTSANIMNTGVIPLPTQILSNLGLTEGFDKAASVLSAGKVKKASSVLTGLEFAAKGLLGPLGRPLKTDASNLIEYNKPLIDFAIKNNLVNSKGEYVVGKASWNKILGNKAYATEDISLSEEEMRKGFRIVGDTKGRQGAYKVIDDKGNEITRYTDSLYDKMQRESAGSGAAAKIANFGLGQFTFNVDEKSGKAIVTDSWDSNNTAAYYFGEAEDALKRGDIYNALFKGFSGILRVNQNSAFGLGDTGFANTLPGGVDIASKSSFSKILNQRKPPKQQLTPEQISQGYFSSTTNKFYASYAEALKDPKVKAAAQLEETKKKLGLTLNQTSTSSALMNTLMSGDKNQSSTSSTLMGDQYYSSTTGKYYKNYTEALKDPRVKAAAQLEETKKKLSLAPSQAPKVTVLEPPPTGPNGGPRVTVIKSGKKGKSPTLSGSGSETPYINPGNGNKSKFNILGIPVPFF